MAKDGRKKNRTSFGTGNKVAVGKGRPRMPPEVKAARQMNRAEVERIFNKYLFATEGEILDVMNDTKTPFGERMFLKVMAKCEDQGDHYRLEFILNRLVGKVPQAVDHTVTAPYMEIEKLDGTIVRLGAREKKDATGEEEE